VPQASGVSTCEALTSSRRHLSQQPTPRECRAAIRRRRRRRDAAKAVAPAAAPEGGLSGKAFTTRYWDCAKPSCSWAGKAAVSQPAWSCDKGGDASVSSAAASGADGGPAFTCNAYSPWEVSADLSYGFAAFAGSAGESRTCCACFELRFTSGPVTGKRMVVQVINTGYDLQGDGQFDLQIPGGGIGAIDGCSNQWGADASWGAQYGGLAGPTCDVLPAPLRAGCEWRFGWFKGADNPEATFSEVACPDALTSKSGCSRR